MNSKQLNFFLAPTQWQAIDKFLKEHGCTVFPRRLDDELDEENYSVSELIGKVFQVCISKSDFRPSLNWKKTSDGKTSYLDIVSSNAIEFSLGGFFPNRMTEFERSRLYYVSKYESDNGQIKKSKIFLDWADNVVKIFKKSFSIKLDESSGTYMSQAFINWNQVQNGVLSTDGTKYVFAESKDDGSFTEQPKNKL